MRQRRKRNRTMCADLLTICWTGENGLDRSEAAILEDISVEGVCLQSEHPLPLYADVSVHYPNGQYQGKVMYCKTEEGGYLVGIEFDSSNRWSKADFQPSHLLDLELPLLKH